VTVVLVEFKTVALNCVVALTATLTDDWFSETLTAGGGVVFEELLLPPQLDIAKVAARARVKPESLRDDEVDFIKILGSLPSQKARS
jgi:hypothetical protein